MKKLFLICLMILSLFTIASCGSDDLELNNQKISHETKFGGIYIEITIDDFNKKGFSYGDSLEIEFSNGYKLEDLPYYNGYYTNVGEPLLVGYPGYPYIRAGINNGDDLFIISGVSEDDTANIKLKEKGKYLSVQEALDIQYSDIQGDLSDEVFGNFRNVKVGNLKDNILYRSASPVDNQHNRANVVDKLIENKVNTVIDLADNNTELAGFVNDPDFDSDYYKNIYNNNRVIALSMNMNFQMSDGKNDDAPRLFTQFKDNTFSSKLISGLRFMIENDGPYLVHCVEGKDRTGFVCMVIEALAGASYNEIINDYMITYDNYYGINLESDSSKYNIIKEKNIEVMLKTIINDDSVDIKTADYNHYCKEYLIRKGMAENEVLALQTKITE